MDVQWNEWAFLCALVFFHTSEFLLAAYHMREELGWSSMLISKPYTLAMAIAMLEHVGWAYWAPWVRQQSIVAALGLLLMLAGDLVRKAGMITAGPAFTHKIRMYKRENHQLVTHGVYQYVRHPGYLGWWMWAVGVQVLLVNPICTVVFAYWAWRFFKQRIEFEEEMLVSFFGAEYELYRARTGTCIPGVP